MTGYIREDGKAIPQGVGLTPEDLQELADECQKEIDTITDQILRFADKQEKKKVKRDEYLTQKELLL